MLIADYRQVCKFKTLTINYVKKSNSPYYNYFYLPT